MLLARLVMPNLRAVMPSQAMIQRLQEIRQPVR